MDPARLLGVDVGGTFTDVVIVAADGIQTAKVLSTASPDQGVLAAWQATGIPASALSRFCHGMTVATNALLERKGSPTLLVATAGFGDVLWLGRQHRPSLYDLTQARPDPVALGVVEVAERCGPQGVIQPLETREVERVLQEVAQWVETRGIQSIAVGLLFSFLYPDHEQRLGQALQARFPQLYICLSSAVAPEMREYERWSTMVLDAYLTPPLAGYLSQLAQQCQTLQLPSPLIMQSSGGVARIPEITGSQALLSGPAGGVWGAATVGSRSGFTNLLTFDMGGTSTDVALIRDGQPQMSAQAEICGYPVLQPQIDIHTVSAGGGSLAQVQPGGGLRVGPESAGSLPGPACYGQGGRLATVTDANCWLGYLGESLGGGSVTLHRDLAESALMPIAETLGLSLADTALGIRTLANVQMARALRVVSIERGQDPAALALMAFGGAGPMHACSLAVELGITTVLIPAACGVLSALGMALAPWRRDYRRAVPHLGIPSHWADHLQPLMAQAQADWQADRGSPAVSTPDLTFNISLDLRYQGQSFELGIPVHWGEDPSLITARFHQEHQRYYGWQDPQQPIELVTARLQASLPSPKVGSLQSPQVPGDPYLGSRLSWIPNQGFERIPCYAREKLAPGTTLVGPALILFREATLVLDPGWTGVLDPEGTLRLETS